MEYANSPYYRPRNPFTPNDILMFKQYRDEPIYDAWTRFKNLLRIVPHHSFDLASLTQIFYYRVNHCDQRCIEDFTNGDLRELNAEEAWDAIEECAQYYYRIDNPTNVSTSQLTTNFKDNETNLFGDEYVEVEIPKWMSPNIVVQNKHVGNLDTIEDEVEIPKWMSPKIIVQNKHIGNPSPQSTPQVLPSFEAHTPPVTYPEKVEETLGIPMEVEPLEQAPLEDIGLNTCNDNLTLSSREFPSVDEPEPQLLHNFSSLDLHLGDKRGADPPINQYYPGSFRMKEAIHSPPSPHVAYLHPKGVYRYFHPHLILSVGKTSPISVK